MNTPSQAPDKSPTLDSFLRSQSDGVLQAVGKISEIRDRLGALGDRLYGGDARQAPHQPSPHPGGRAIATTAEPPAVPALRDSIVTLHDQIGAVSEALNRLGV